MAMTPYINTGSSDLELNASGATFTEIAPDTDELLFTAGSDEVADGEDSPTESEKIQAGVRYTGSQIVVDDYFLNDIGSDLLREIDLMGNQNTRYVLAFDFDGETASEPTLEIWDDEDLDTIDNTLLGAGTASSSWVRGITTTAGSPGAGWATSADRLAGSSDGHYLLLNDGSGALPSADTLYCNLCIIVPASASNSGFSASPVIAVKWLES